jgi:hypothetical protein
VSLESRIEAAEEELKPEEAGRDLLITIHEEQHERVGDELVSVKRPIIGYTETVWSSPGKRGTRIGTRRALYDGGKPSSFDPIENQTGD